MASLLEGARAQQGYTYAALGQKARVNVGQSFRICRGDFKRLSENVLKICEALEVDPNRATVPFIDSPADPAANMLKAEILASWDHTPDGARRLVKILRALRQSSK